MRLMILCVLVATVWTLELPSSFKRCPVSAELDGKPNECLREAIHDAIVQLRHGDAQLEAATLDPLEIKLITIEQGESPVAALKTTLTDSLMRGISDLRIDSITGKLSSPEKFYLKGTGYTPRLAMAGHYRIEGRILVLPIQGQGRSNFTMDDVKAEFSVKGERQEKGGVRYLKVTQMKLNIKSTSRVWVHMDNLFNGDKTLGDQMNLFLNQNGQEIFQDMRSALNRAISTVVRRYSQHILEDIPFDDIFITS